MKLDLFLLRNLGSSFDKLYIFTAMENIFVLLCLHCDFGQILLLAGEISSLCFRSFIANNSQHSYTQNSVRSGTVLHIVHYTC
jgi:hypothetical protein